MRDLSTRFISRYSSIYAVSEDGDEHSICELEQTHCCGIYQLYKFQQDDVDLEDNDTEAQYLQCKYISLIQHYGLMRGGGYPRTTDTGLLVWLSIVENWNSAESLKEALVAGGWAQVSDVVNNPNSGNQISMWLIELE